MFNMKILVRILRVIAVTFFMQKSNIDWIDIHIQFISFYYS